MSKRMDFPSTGNLLEADLPPMQNAAVNSIYGKISAVGAKYGFEVKSIEMFDGNRRLEVGVEPLTTVIHKEHGPLFKSCSVSTKVEGRTIAEIGAQLAHGLEDWAMAKLRVCDKSQTN